MSPLTYTSRVRVALEIALSGLLDARERISGELWHEHPEVILNNAAIEAVKNALELPRPEMNP